MIAAMLRLLVEAMGLNPIGGPLSRTRRTYWSSRPRRAVIEPADLDVVNRERAALQHLLLVRQAAVREESG